MQENLSPAELFSELPEEEQEEFLASLTPEVRAQLKYHWNFWARPNQLQPEHGNAGGPWSTWMILAGRGFGKTRTGAETIRDWACGKTPLAPGMCSRIALVAETGADARDVMVLGESGLLAVHPPEFRPSYHPSKRLVEWPNGAQAWLYNAVEPDQLRGPQHDGAWCDEMAKWRYMQATWDQLQFGMRLGDEPRTVITTTPRPLPLIRKLLKDPMVAVTRGATRDNAQNMAASFMREIEEKYAGTRLGRQELDGEILDDIPGALWNRETLDECRVSEIPEDLDRVIVAVDPATSSEEGSDETGIVVVGLARDTDGYARGYILEDGSLKGSPEEWAKKAVSLYRKWEADKIVAEKNQGGDMVMSVLRAQDRSVPVKLVHASRGKVVRAEPISALYEQKRVHHVGIFDKLEDQMCLFSVDNFRTPAMGSPDRVDALVWGLTEIFDKITARRRVKQDVTTKTPKQNYHGHTGLEGIATGWMAG